MERLFKSGIVTTLLGLTILCVAVILYISKSHSETEAGAVGALGLLLLRSKDSLIGLSKK
jgi:TRAP-type mannitol/chloroaromatic compound transport system permease large subunit